MYQKQFSFKKVVPSTSAYNNTSYPPQQYQHQREAYTAIPLQERPQSVYEFPDRYSDSSYPNVAIPVPQGEVVTYCGPGYFTDQSRNSQGYQQDALVQPTVTTNSQIDQETYLIERELSVSMFYFTN